MFNYIHDNYELISDVTNESEGQRIWVYDIDERDFFFREVNNWFDLKADAYVLQIEDATFYVPLSYYILIGDYDVGLDVITPAEIVGRKFEAFVFNKNLEPDSWALDDIRVVGYDNNHSFILPDIKGLVPVAISNKKAIMICEKDVYNKLKNLSFADII
jgi:hypothetical protein